MVKQYRVPSPNEVNNVKKRAIVDLIAQRYQVAILKYGTKSIVLLRNDTDLYKILRNHGLLKVPYSEEIEGVILELVYNEQAWDVMRNLCSNSEVIDGVIELNEQAFA